MQRLFRSSQERSAIKIQAVARGFKGRKRVKAMIQKEKEEAITRIQARIRLKRGRLESSQMKKKIQREKRANEAAITVQKQFRGKVRVCGSRSDELRERFYGKLTNITEHLLLFTTCFALRSSHVASTALRTPSTSAPACQSRRCTEPWRSSTWTT